MYPAKVRYLPMLLKVGFEFCNILRSFGCDYHVIGCNSNYGVFVTGSPEENQMINIQACKTKMVSEDSGHFLIPAASSLLKTIKAFKEPTSLAFLAQFHFS